jgi:ubiquinone/menaquinone biosynthesis C-methylase UbiE
MFIKRHYDKELMDDFSIVDQRIDEALHELKQINKYFGGFRTSYSGLKHMLKTLNDDSINILDIGSGGSDILESIRRKNDSLKIFSIDKNKRVCEILKNQNDGETISEPIYGDVFHLPLKNKSMDVIHSSLFLHHFNEEQIKKIILSSLGIARKGIVINDLRRSAIAVVLIKFLIKLFSKSSLFKYDAPLSIKKGFIKSELVELLNELQIKNCSIKRKWAFRWLILIPAEDDEKY